MFRWGLGHIYSRNSLVQSSKEITQCLSECSCTWKTAPLKTAHVARAIIDLGVFLMSALIQQLQSQMKWERLKHLGKYDTVYGGLGTMREDGSDSHLSSSRMPTGMLEHMICFHHATAYRHTACDISMHTRTWRECTINLQCEHRVLMWYNMMSCVIHWMVQRRL